MINLTKVRNEAGLSQFKLAKKAGLHQPIICQIERGMQPSEHHKQCIAKALGWDDNVEQLFEQVG